MVNNSHLQWQLGLLAGCSVERIGISVWPCKDRLEETDVRLYLKLRDQHGETVELVIGTDADGQTPRVEFDHADDWRLIDDFENRKREWAQHQFWVSRSHVTPELFLAPADSKCELSGFCGQVIQHVFLVCFSDDGNDPTGVCLEFEPGCRLWSIPGAYGNTVRTKITDDLWPDSVWLKEVA